MRSGNHAGVLLTIALLAVTSAGGGCGDSDEDQGTRGGGQTKQAQKPVEEEPKAVAVRPKDEKEVRAVANRFFTATSKGHYGTACSLYAPEGLSERGGKAACAQFLAGVGDDIGIPAGVPKISRVTFIDRGTAAFVSLEGLDIGIEMDRLEDRWGVDEVGGY